MTEQRYCPWCERSFSGKTLDCRCKEIVEKVRRQNEANDKKKQAKEEQVKDDAVICAVIQVCDLLRPLGQERALRVIEFIKSAWEKDQ